MLTKKRKIGNLGEKIAKKHLENKGFSFVDANFLKPFGEIDLIMKKGKIYYFVEVKTTRNINFEFLPEQHFDFKKMQKFEKVVNFYVEQNDISDFDLLLLAVYLDIKNKKAKVKIIDSIF
ncbi:YraN family protein [Candidatus Campbellbacteria bacterium]|nr:MAG: YraN family protein [Candidatus Campbellbacteria bacterium]